MTLLYNQGVCTPGKDGAGLDISQKMECVNGSINQYVYANANCSDEAFKTYEDVPGYCGGTVCSEYAQVMTYLNESCSDVDGYLILPMLTYDCYPYNFGNGQSFKFFCDEYTIDLGIFDSSDCSDSEYTAYTVYGGYTKEESCIDGEYAEVIDCPKEKSVANTFDAVMITSAILLSVTFFS